MNLACSRPLERRAKESARVRKRGGNGGEKKRERRGACNHFLKHLMPPPFSKMCQHVKMSNFSLSRVTITRASSRVRAVVHTSLRCRGYRKILRVWDFNPENPVDFAKKKLTCLGTKVPRVSLSNAVRNKKLINATLSSDETLVLADVVSSLGCVFASF